MNDAQGILPLMQLKCNGVGRDKDCLSALAFYFNRRVTDDEMRFLDEVVKRAVYLIQAKSETGKDG